MDLVFTKGAGKLDRLDVIRADGTTETVDCPKQRVIPHDMVHYAVESVLGARGFLGRVAAGEEADVRMVSDPASDGIERLVEVFQGDEWSGGTATPEEMIDLYRVTCEARGCPHLPVDSATIAAVRSRIAVLTATWSALPVGGELRLTLG